MVCAGDPEGLQPGGEDVVGEEDAAADTGHLLWQLPRGRLPPLPLRTQLQGIQVNHEPAIQQVSSPISVIAKALIHLHNPSFFPS